MIRVPFLPIEQWLGELIGATDDELRQVAEQAGRAGLLSTQLFRLRQPPNRLPLTADVGVLVRLHERLRGKDFERRLWCELLFGGSFQVTEGMAHDFLDRGVAPEEFPYAQASESVLRRLSGTHSTAAYWLAQDMYRKPQYSVEEFRRFLREHRHQGVIIDSLVRELPAEDPAKDDAFMEEVDRREDAAELRRLREMKLASVHAARPTLAPSECEALFDLGDPRVLRSLAANPTTPSHLLERLAGMKGAKFARQIRILAAEELRRRTGGRGASRS